MKQLNFGSTNGKPNDPDKTVVHLNTKEQARIILKKGGCVDDFIELLIREYGQDLCVKFVGSGVVGDYLSHWLRFNYTILPAEAFIRLNTDVENPFTVGDRVYCILNGWGEITTIEEDSEVPISVKFDNGEYGFYYHTGRYYPTSQPTLSFTPYTLQGFSQERPKPDIREGQLIYVRHEDHTEWLMRFFSHFEGDDVRYFLGQKKTGKTQVAKQYSLTNPLEEK